MRRSRFTKLTSLLAGLMFATVAVPAGATTASPTIAAKGFGPVYDSKHEITISGPIQEVVTKRVVGSPAGVHLFVTGSQGVVDAHLGPFLGKEIQESLHAGTTVQIVGAMTTQHGKDYLLVRRLIVAGRTVTVRSEHGSLLLVQQGTTRRMTRSTTKTAANGGAR